MPSAKKTSVEENIRFEWELLGDLYIPVIYREKKKFLPVRIVELKLLSSVPLPLPEELKALRKCPTFYLTEKEAAALNVFNLKQCKAEYGKEPFTTNDVLLELRKFRKFFDCVSETVISKTALDLGLTEGGWLQINNTVCPYLWIEKIKHVPLDVIANAAELVGESESMPAIKATEAQLKYFNDLCTKLEISFSFSKETELVSLLSLKLNVDPIIVELPADKPFDHATYIDLTLNRQAITQIKVRARQAMNEYYNAVKLKKLGGNKLEVIAVDSSASTEVLSDVDVESLDDEATSSAVSVKSSGNLNIDYTRPPTSTSACQANEPGLNIPSTAQKQSSATSTPSELGKILAEDPVAPKKHRPRSKRSPPKDGPSNPKKKKSDVSESPMMQTYKLNNLNLPMRYRTVTEELKKSISELSSLLVPFAKSIPLGISVDMATVDMISKCVNIHGKVCFVFKESLRLLNQQLTSDNSSSGVHEATIIAADAAGNPDFWNATAHKISVESARYLNDALVSVVLNSPVYSVQKKQDIVHYMVGGVFGGRTASDAANFKFLQEVMMIASYAIGSSGSTPFHAYNITIHCLERLAIVIHKWCSLVEAKPIKLESRVFRSSLAHLYESVYAPIYLPRPTDLPPHTRTMDMSRVSSASQGPIPATLHHQVTSVPVDMPLQHQIQPPAQKSPLCNSANVHIPTLSAEMQQLVNKQPQMSAVTQKSQYQINPTFQTQLNVLAHQRNFSCMAPPVIPSPPSYDESSVMNKLVSTQSSLIQPVNTQSFTARRSIEPSTEPAPAQPSSLQPDSAQPSPLQPGPGQPSPLQSCPGQPSPVQPGSTQPIPLQPGPTQFSILQPGPTQPSPLQSGPTQPSPRQSDTTQLSPQQSGSLQLSLAQFCPLQADLAQPSPRQLSPAQPTPRLVQPTVPSSMLINPSQHMTTVASSLPNTAVLPRDVHLTPAIPSYLLSTNSLPATLPAKVDCADAISLVRCHGKKIPTFQAGTGSTSWVLVEDVQKIYYPRLAADAFIDQLSSNLPGIMIPISQEVSTAFKAHYGMAVTENFEIEMMIAYYSLSTVLSKLQIGAQPVQLLPSSS